jgi:hypothetical protein
MCATCTAVYKTECFYDEASESRRGKTPAIKREAPGTSESSDNAEFLIKSIRGLPESDVHELIQHIRRDQRLDIAALADTWRRTTTLPLDSPDQSLETDLSVVMGKPAFTQTGETRHFGHTSSMSLVPEDENYTATGYVRPLPPLEPGEYKDGTWTNVTCTSIGRIPSMSSSRVSASSGTSTPVARSIAVLC